MGNNLRTQSDHWTLPSLSNLAFHNWFTIHETLMWLGNFLHLFLQISANVRLGKLMFVFHNYQDTIREVPSLEIFSRRHSQRSVLRLLQSKKVRYF